MREAESFAALCARQPDSRPGFAGRRLGSLLFLSASGHRHVAALARPPGLKERGFHLPQRGRGPAWPPTALPEPRAVGTCDRRRPRSPAPFAEQERCAPRRPAAPACVRRRRRTRPSSAPTAAAAAGKCQRLCCADAGLGRKLVWCGRGALGGGWKGGLL